MRFARVIVVFAFLSGLSAGCIFFDESYKAVSYYDLKTPENSCPEGLDLKVRIVRNDVSTKYKMVYRTEDNQILIDDYNKWTQPPGLLVNRYMDSVFRANKTGGRGKDMSLIFEGRIVFFEMNMITQKAVFGMDYTITNASDGKALLQKNAVFCRKFNSVAAREFAAAMSEAVGEFTDDLKKELINLKRIDQSEKAAVKPAASADTEKKEK